MALKPLNSVGGFSVGEVPANVILPNADITANNGTFQGNVAISNATVAWGVLTDNLYYSNGVPWDFQQAAGSNGELQFNMGDDFAASPNLTFNNTTQLFTVTGNANITGTLTAGALEVDEIFNGNSNVAIPVANGNVNISVSGNANLLVVTGTGANVNGYLDVSGNATAANLRLDDGTIESLGTSGVNVIPANAAAGITLQGNVLPNSNVAFNIGGTSKYWANVYANNAIIAANIQSGNANLGNAAVANYGNINFDLGVTQTVFAANLVANVSANVSNIQVANFVVSNLTPSSDDQYYLGTTLKRWKDINISGNANIATLSVSGNGTFGNLEFGNSLTGNYANFDNDVVVQGNIANANNISVTNSLAANTGNFSGNITALNANLGNLATANYINVAQNVDINGSLDATNANFVGNLYIDPSGLANYGIKTDYLYYANGTPWDLQEAAGNNNEVQFNSNDNFAASANFTFNPTTDTLTVTGNANISNTVNTPNINSGTGNLTLTSNGFSSVFENNGNVTFPGNVMATTFYGNVVANITVTAANTTVLFSDDGLIDGTTAFTFDKLSNIVTMSGNVELGLTGQNQLINLSNTALEIRGGWDAASSTAVNIVAGDYSNTTNWGKLSIQGNVSGNAVGFAEANAFIFSNPGYSSGNVVKVDILNPAAASTTTGVIQANGGIGVTGNGYFGGDLVVTANIANANNINATNYVYANNANITANLTSGNASLGNLATANYVNVASNVITSNLTVNTQLSGNTANFSGNVIVPNLAVNLELAGNTANFTGNVILSGPNVTVNNYLTGNIANFSGNLTSLNANLGNLADANFIRTSELFNGNSNIVINPNGNVVVSVTGTANVHILSNLGVNVVGYVQANGEGSFGSVETISVTSNVGNLLLESQQSGNSYVQLRAFGDGTIDVGSARISSLATPNAASDAATKQYVDDVAQGLNVHDSCYTATGNTLAILTGGTITYNNGTGGVGANLVLSGSPTANFTAANTFDGNVTATVGSRILVKNEANAAHNGIYVVDSATVLTRASDYDTVPEVEAGDFVFIQDGDTYNDTGWVQTSVVVTIGTDPINFTQFSGAGTYQAGSGLTLTGTVFSVNVDNVTTEISGGNVIVKANAQLTTPNIGAATGTSVDLTGNVLAGNVNSNSLITAANINVTSNVLADTFNANSNIVSNNATINLALTGNTANFSGNVVVPNLTVNLALAGNTANFTGNIVAANANLGNLVTANYVNVASNVTTSNLTVNTELSGNTANFSGNVIFNGGNVTVGNALLGNTANFSGNVVTPNLTVNLELAGNTANFSGNLVSNNFLANGVANVGNLYVQANVTSALLPNANLTLDLGSSTQRWQDVYAGNIDASGNLTISGNLSSNNYTANIITANNYINVGNTSIRQAEVTTTAITANQTISTVPVSGITGIEWIVKAIDSSGSKYSMAIVSAVTDGSNVDYSTFGGVTLGSTTGSLAVNVVGSNVELQVTPASSNSTYWVTQYRTI